ncbi:GNAT family N-acetyltransferase [Haloglomus litoreum]|uniref:GNAT family N-acetyltransferase n=1 Tax=Haloglomus litoreum TaxID=3034026 RepID=UPI0023E83353|nr:GNAT family N-acetyltransferase [Haloglomus sp. DT116]
MLLRFSEGVGEYADQVRAILRSVDEEFVPPLSSRSGTAEVDDLGGDEGSGIDSYFQACLDQQFLFAETDDELVGVLSYRHRYTPPFLRRFSPSNYPTILAVRREWRNEGVGTALYRTFLFDLPPAYRLPYVVARTWNENVRSIRLHEKFGFDRVHTIPNHRAPGVHTVYFAKALSPHDGE